MVGIKGIRDVKGLILLANPLSSSSCCQATQGSLPVRIGMAKALRGTWLLDGKHDVRKESGAWADCQCEPYHGRPFPKHNMLRTLVFSTPAALRQ
jgi:hypothetical protein